VPALRAQIERDVVEARASLSDSEPSPHGGWF
jgi:hypothetical protein